MLRIKKFPVNPFPVNCYVVFDEESREAAIIDPGCYWAEEREALCSYINDEKLKVRHLLLTHLHLDHTLAVPFVAKTFNVPFSASSKDKLLLDNSALQASQYGLKLEFEPIAIDKDLKEGEIIELGKEQFKVIEVPGHSPGSLVFYSQANNLMFAGDVLFMGSIGRTDLPGGNHRQLIEGINSKLMTLDENTVVYSGHGPETNIGYEKNYNPYL